MIIVMNKDLVCRPGDVPGRMALAPDWAGNFGDILINEVIRDIDATYRTIADRDHRASTRSSSRRRGSTQWSTSSRDRPRLGDLGRRSFYQFAPLLFRN